MLPSKRRGSEGGEEEVWKSLCIEILELCGERKPALFQLFVKLPLLCCDTPLVLILIWSCRRESEVHFHARR
jgi:hypothetical protein